MTVPLTRILPNVVFPKFTNYRDLCNLEKRKVILKVNCPTWIFNRKWNYKYLIHSNKTHKVLLFRSARQQ